MAASKARDMNKMSGKNHKGPLAFPARAGSSAGIDIDSASLELQHVQTKGTYYDVIQIVLVSVLLDECAQTHQLHTDLARKQSAKVIPFDEGFTAEEAHGEAGSGVEEQQAMRHVTSQGSLLSEDNEHAPGANSGIFVAFSAPQHDLAVTPHTQQTPTHCPARAVPRGNSHCPHSRRREWRRVPGTCPRKSWEVCVLVNYLLCRLHLAFVFIQSRPHVHLRLSSGQ